MKIKHTLLIAFCALGLCVSTAKAVTIETTPSYTTITDQPAIYIEFKQSCGNVDIFIYNENGQQIYGTTVNTSVQQMVVIPISNTTNNGYSIMLSNANGCAEGDVRNN